MEELLAYLARNLVTKPEEVRVVRSERDGAVLLELHVSPDDVGKVIGRRGRIIRSLRALARAAGQLEGRSVTVEVVD